MSSQHSLYFHGERGASLSLTMQVSEFRNQDQEGISHALTATCFNVTEMLRFEYQVIFKVSPACCILTTLSAMPTLEERSSLQPVAHQTASLLAVQVKRVS